MEARCSLRSLRKALGFFALSTALFQPLATGGAPINAGSLQPRRDARLETLSLSPQVVHFKDVVAGQSYTQPVMLTNHGRSTVTIAKVWRNNSIFALRGLKMPLKINSKESVRIEVAFIPRRSGRLGTDFAFITGRANSLVLRADGSRASGGVVANPKKVSFGNVQVGSSALFPITLINNGSANRIVSRLWISGKQFGMTELNLPTKLAPGESLTLNAIFQPRQRGANYGEIIVDTGGASLSIPVAGQGLDPGHLNVAPAQLNFGNVTAATSVTLSGLLQAGRSPVTIYSAGVTSSEFALRGLSFPLTIAAGQSKPFQVTFTPGSTGATSATLSLQGPPGLIAEEYLLGNATPGTQHKVILSWNPSGSGVVGYNIYRAIASGGQYSQINPIPDSNPSYVDSTVQAQHTYYYVTAAVAANGKQSAFSNQVQVVIP
ncbi:MAG: choice-of-anchor D domain-containing protein [Terriglobales bacterium]